MVVAIEGVISKKEPTFVVIKCTSGVSYGVFVSLFCSSSLNLGSKTELLITQIIKEDSNKFFGFLDKNEQIMFESLLKVNGVGTSTAMAVCSTLTVNDFYKALGSNDESVLKKVPGIGAKSAKRIIIELGDKKLNLAQGDELNSQALAALLSLGFKQDKILQTLATCESKELSTLIKEALKKLS